MRYARKSPRARPSRAGYGNRRRSPARARSATARRKPMARKASGRTKAQTIRLVIESPTMSQMAAQRPDLPQFQRPKVAKF